MWPFKKKRISFHPVVINTIDDDYIIDFVIQWNKSFPIDRWWREKHKIAFNSTAHREVSFLDMRIEFEEDLIFRKKFGYSLYVPDKGEWVVRLQEVNEDENLTTEEKLEKYKEEFKSIDLSQYDDK